MKAIIIAAGMGNRLGDHTRELPKCLLDIAGKTIIERQIEAFKQNGIEKFVIVKGHQAEKLDFLPARSYLNGNYRNNNILCSLMTAEPELDGPFIASYSDILYTAGIVESLLASPHDIALVVDTAWRPKYEGRTEHPESEAEKVAWNDQTGCILELGKHIHIADRPDGEFIGLFKCTAKGARILREAFTRARQEYEGKPFFNAPVFEKAYITDMMLYLISQGVEVHCVPITEGWMEIDTEQDLNRARQWMRQEGTVSV